MTTDLSQLPRLTVVKGTTVNRELTGGSPVLKVYSSFSCSNATARSVAKLNVVVLVS